MDYEKFLQGVDDALGKLMMMLSSKSQGDTIEAIKVFKLLYQYGIKDSKNGIKKMLTLIFSKDESIQNAVVETYEQIYFEKSQSARDKSNSLLELMDGATLTDITCIEELLNKFIKKDIFEKDVYKQLWVSYSKIFQN